MTTATPTVPETRTPRRLPTASTHRTGASPVVAPNASPSTAPTSPRASSRIAALDTARGLAMVLVCLSHFAWSTAMTAGETRALGWMVTISMIASPTFILVSGIMLGYMYAGEADAYHRFASKLRERGLLLLTVAHLVMLPAFHYMAPSSGEAFRVLPITTTIGLCLLLGPTVVVRVNCRARVLLGVAIVAGSWAIVYATPATPQHTLLDIAKDALVGARTQSWWFYSFPFLPWFGAYLVGSAVGQDVRAAGDGHVLRAVLVRWAAWAIALGLAVEGAVFALSVMHPRDHLFAELAASVGSPLSKVPPSPVYLLVYGAAGLVMTALADLVIERGWARPVTDRVADVGRSSLVVFVAQSYLYYVLALHVLPPTLANWPYYFLATLGMVYLVARLWLAAGGNRLLVVPGYWRLRSWHAARRSVAAR